MLYRDLGDVRIQCLTREVLGDVGDFICLTGKRLVMRDNLYV